MCYGFIRDFTPNAAEVNAANLYKGKYRNSFSVYAIQQAVTEGHMRPIPVPEYMRSHPPFPGVFRIPVIYQRIEGKYRYW